MEYSDRTLQCADCASEFIFTAGEQLFFADKQFKNDPKRCKPCKAARANQRRAGQPRDAAQVVQALPLSRTETRTRCSTCGLETTVPFKPTQGRPVLCRACFQRARVPTAVAAVANLDNPAAQVAAVAAELGLGPDPPQLQHTPAATPALLPAGIDVLIAADAAAIAANDAAKHAAAVLPGSDAAGLELQALQEPVPAA